MNLPLAPKARWWASELATTLFAAVPTLLAAGGGIVQGVRQGDVRSLQLGIAVVIALVVGTTFKALHSRRKDLREYERRSPRDLEGGLYVLHAAILAMRGLPYDDTMIAKLRVTLFRVLEADDVAVQIVPFIGGGDGHEGTRVSRRSGIVGRAILRGKPAASLRDRPFDEYVRVLVDDYAMPFDEARQMPEDRLAFLAVPIVDRKSARIIGVVYMDSPDRTFFSPPARPRDVVSDAFVQQIAGACTGLVTYAQLRYPEGSAR